VTSDGLGGAILAAARDHPAAAALVGEDFTLSYGALAARAETLATTLGAAGLTPDEPVAVMVSNRPLDLVAFLGVWRAGGVVVPIHRSNPAAVTVQHVSATGARVIVDTERAPVTEPGWRAAGDLRIADRPAPVRRVILARAALIIFTSGSTGAPKGAVLSHRALGGKLDAIDSLLAFGAGERTLLVLNITFSFGIWVSLLTLKKGGTLVMHGRFAPRAFCATLAAERITRVGVVPTMMRAMLAEAASADLAAALGAVNRENALRQILIGGESLGTALAAELMSRFPRARLIDIYGLTETATSDFFLFPEDYPAYAGCIGRASPNVAFRIADAAGRALPPGEVGELQIRTPYVMNGYLDAPELTQRAFADGWFCTGDMARVRDRDVVELAGRAKELISRGGNKVSPLEIEQVFAAHPDVAAAMASGVADPILGERIHLLVVAKPGRTCSAAALREFGVPRLAKFKQPDVFHFAAELPLGRTGKADRGALRRLIESGELQPVQGPAVT
jgi:long-chain acyl-CoA synthetase